LQTGCRSTHRSHIALILQGIPHSGYISPEAMVCCLSAFRLTRLEGLDSPWILNPLYLALTGKGDVRLRPSAQPSLLPLIFRSEGVSEHPEALVARIDAPLLNGLRVIFLRQTHFSTLHDLSSSSVAQRISRHPMTHVRSFPIATVCSDHTPTQFEISCRQSDRQLFVSCTDL
jgi:hypothetical protein